jgi:hypothetical protein
MASAAQLRPAHDASIARLSPDGIVNRLLG